MKEKEKAAQESKRSPDETTVLPKQYQKPSIESEDLLAFAASCNGTANGSRKANVGAPNFCRSNRLNS